MESWDVERILDISPLQLDQDPNPGRKCKKKGVNEETRVTELKSSLPEQWF